MKGERLAAFSDGVIAVALTIMVLELKAPETAEWAGLIHLWPTFLSYILSFVYIGIYWNNHHHLLHTVEHVDGLILWASMHLLFWLTLIPFCTAWMGEAHFASAPTAVYGVALFMPAIAYFLLQSAIVKAHGRDSLLARALGHDFKGKISPFLYAAGIGVAFVEPWISDVLYALVALMWIIPDRRIEKVFR